MVEALLGFGGNVGNARDTLHRALETFCAGASVCLVARSSDYRTPPWGITAQPPFINLCIAIETTLTPRNLLERALAVEAAYGRDRSQEVPWGPRPLDIDVLVYDDAELSEPWLTLPHPHLLDRAFVLVPLVEIRPDLIVRGVPIAEALKSLDASGIEKLPPL